MATDNLQSDLLTDLHHTATSLGGPRATAEEDRIARLLLAAHAEIERLEAENALLKPDVPVASFEREDWERIARPMNEAQLAETMSFLRGHVAENIASDGVYFDAIDEADESISDYLKAEQERRYAPENR